jgi:hypothetical protein
MLPDVEVMCASEPRTPETCNIVDGRGGGIRTHDLVVPNDWGDEVPDSVWIDTVINFLQIVVDLPKERGVKLSEVVGVTASYIEKNYCTFTA